MPIPPDLAWVLSDQIGHAYSVVLATVGEQVVDQPFTVAEFVALAVLDGFADGLTQTAWGEYQGVTRQRAHTVSTKLAAAELITITKEGRASTVVLTRAGRSMVRRLQPVVSAELARRMGRLTATEARQLSGLLAKMFPLD